MIDTKITTKTGWKKWSPLIMVVVAVLGIAAIIYIDSQPSAYEQAEEVFVARVHSEMRWEETPNLDLWYDSEIRIAGSSACVNFSLGNLYRNIYVTSAEAWLIMDAAVATICPEHRDFVEGY